MAKKDGSRTFGNVRKLPSGRYQARVTNPDGTSRSLGVFPTKTRAETEVATAHAEQWGGTYVDPKRGDRLVVDYARDLIATGRYKTRTRSLYGRLLREWIDAPLTVPGKGSTRAVHLGHMPLRAVSPAVVRDWHAAVRSESKRRAVDRHTRIATSPRAVNAAIRAWAAAEGKPIAATGRIPADARAGWFKAHGPAMLPIDAPPTAGETEAAQAYRLLHTVFHAAVVERLVVESPVALTGAGEADAPERTPATLTELTVIAQEMPPRYRAAVWVAALSALRSGELFALQRRDYAPASRTVKVQRALEEWGAEAVTGTTKTAKSTRSIVLPVAAAEALEAHMRAHTASGPRALIFTTSTGRPVYPSTIGKPFGRARAAAGRPDLRWHDLRHTGATLAAATGAPLRDIQDMLGHSTVTAAMRYQHTAQDAASRLAAGIDALLAGERDRSVGPDVAAPPVADG